MTKSALCFWAGCLALGLGGVAAAADAPKAKREKPAIAIRTATKNFAKAKSYRVELAVTGGFADDASHAVTERVVTESYLGDVHSGMMHLPGVKAYRTMARGTVQWEGTWKDILSVRQTVRVARLFRFPEEVLANAFKHAPRGGQWVEPEKEAAPAAEPAAAEPEEGDDDEVGPASTTTAVAGSKGAGAVAEPEVPRVIRVEAPPEEALRHIIEVQNSDCFGGG